MKTRIATFMLACCAPLAAAATTVTKAYVFKGGFIPTTVGGGIRGEFNDGIACKRHAPP